MSAGTLHIALSNGTTGLHDVGVRTLADHTSLGLSPTAVPSGAGAVDITLPPGEYEIYRGFHADQGMVLPLTVTP